MPNLLWFTDLQQSKVCSGAGSPADPEKERGAEIANVGSGRGRGEAGGRLGWVYLDVNQIK
jgi:hypothetical protein